MKGKIKEESEDEKKMEAQKNKKSRFSVYLAPEKVGVILDETDFQVRDRLMIGLLYCLALNVSEILELRKKDVIEGDIPKDTVYIHKRAGEKLNSRTLRVTGNLATLLMDYERATSLRENDYLFPGDKEGKPLTRFMVDKIVRGIGTYYGLENLSTSDFRYSMLTYQKGRLSEQEFLDFSGLKALPIAV